jgi:SAM-dependent methyltransferase
VARPVDPEELRRRLTRYRSDYENPVERAQLIEAALPRIRVLLSLLPEGRRDSRLLELGADPFFNSLCLEAVWPGALTHANYSHKGERHGSRTLLDLSGGAERVFEYDSFNVETDEFPYPDDTFDVVVFSELIEHLALNPVWALSEIHRVLKPGGHVVITTPNRLSLERLGDFVRGHSAMVDRYAPLYGYGARHNREWHPGELREVLESTGFDIEEMVVCDLRALPLRERLLERVVKLLLRLWSRNSHDAHIFLRARRRDRFRWYFPPRLFDHMTLYHLYRDPFVEMGINDAIQCAGGWLPLEDGTEAGGPVRRVNGEALNASWLEYATALLRGRAGATRMALRVKGLGPGPGTDVPIQLTLRGAATPDRVLADRRVVLPHGAWTETAVRVAAPAEGEQLELRVGVPRGCDLAVRRIALVA